MIHVSPTTAESLVATGKERWLTKREDKIVAKGIGEITTYWAKVSTHSSSSGGASYDSRNYGQINSIDMSGRNNRIAYGRSSSIDMTGATVSS